MSGPDAVPEAESARHWKTPASLLASAAIFGIMFSALFTRQTLGLNILLSVLLVYAFAVFNAKRYLQKSFRQEPLIYLLTAPVLFLSAVFFLSDTALRIFALPAVLVLLLAQYLVLSGNAIHRWDEGRFVTDLAVGGINRGLLGMHCFTAGALGLIFKGRKKNGAVIGLMVGAGLLMIAMPVLAAADANMASVLDSFFSSLALGDIFLYGFMFLLGASAVAAPVATAACPEMSGKRQAAGAVRRTPVQALTTGIALTMLGLIYVLFAALQFPYFFAPRETLAAALGLTSSAYAVKGFGELVFISCLNFALIALALRFTRPKDGKTQPFLKTVYVLLLAFNFIIMASSHLRMQIYVESYGHSVLRFLSHSFMLLLAVMNAVMLARIFSGKVRALRLFTAAALVYLCLVAAVNPDRYVAAFNIRRYEQTGKIDAAHLLSLSADAIPLTCDFFDKYPELFTEREREHAEYRLARYRAGGGGWPSANLAVIGARSRLEQFLGTRGPR